MNYSPGAFVLVGFVLLFASAVVQFRLFDDVVKEQYYRHRDAWHADGGPFGFFWSPELFRSQWMPDNHPNHSARSRLSRRWIFLTPEWAQDDPVVRRMLRRYRAWSWVCFAMWTVVAVSMFWPKG